MLWAQTTHFGPLGDAGTSSSRSRRASTHWMAGVLACGPGALLSHRSAAALRTLRRSAQTKIEVTVPTQRGRQIAAIRTYVCRRLEDADRTVVDGIPCTSVARTLLDLAAVVDRRVLARACDEADVQRVFDLRAIEELLERSRGRRGAGALRAVLCEHAIGTTLTRSELEERALALFERFASRGSRSTSRSSAAPA